MLLKQFLIAAFITPILANLSTGPAEHNNQRRSIADTFFSSDEDIFNSDDFFKTDNSHENQPIPERNRINLQNIRDPVLRAIYEEEKRLHLDEDRERYDDDMSSEEAREIIRFQRRKLANQFNSNLVPALSPAQSPPLPPPSSNDERNPRGRFLFSSEGGSPFFVGPQNERISADYLTSTQFPILLPLPSNPEEEEEEEIEETTTTAKPILGRVLSIGGVFNKVTSGVGNAVGGIKRTFWGSSQTTTSTTTSSPSNGMFFPEDNNPSNPPPLPHVPQPNSIVFGDVNDNDNANLNCTGTQTEYKGRCYNVLQPLPCPTGQWLIEDDETGKGKCVENKCAEHRDHAFFAGKCVRVRSDGDCTKGMTTYIFKNGEVECDCKEQYLFNGDDGNCYPAYRRGPCRNGHVFVSKITPLGALPATCVRSKCSKDGFFCNAPACPNDRNCIELKSKCPNGVWDIHPITLTPKCLDFNIWKPDKIIGNVPTLACAPGSRRDILGTCRKPTKITFS